MMNANSGEVQSLERREKGLDVWMYVGMAFVLTGVIVETIPEFIYSLVS